MLYTLCQSCGLWASVEQTRCPRCRKKLKVKSLKSTTLSKIACANVRSLDTKSSAATGLVRGKKNFGRHEQYRMLSCSHYTKRRKNEGRKRQGTILASRHSKIPSSHWRFDPAGYYVYGGGIHGATPKALQWNPQVYTKKRKIGRSNKRLLWYRKGRGGRVKYTELTK